MSDENAAVGTVIRHSLFYSISAWAGNLFAIIAIPILTRVFDPAQYGIIDFMTTLMQAMILTLALGLDAGFLRYYAASDDPDERAAYLGTNLIFRTALYTLVCVLFWQGAPFIARVIVGDAELVAVVRATVASLYFYLLNEMMLDVLRANLRVGRVALTSLAYFSLRLGSMIVFVVVLATGIIGIYYATALAAATSLVANLILSREYLALRFSPRKLRQMLAFGLPQVPSDIAVYLLYYADRYFINYMLGFNSVGIYALGDKVAYLSRFFTQGFNKAFKPFVMNSFKQAAARATYRRVFRLYSSALFVIATGVSIYGVEIIRIFATPEFTGAYVVIPFLIYSQIFYSLSLTFSVGIDIAEKTVHRAWIGLIAAILNPVLNLLLIGQFGLIGAAAATLISYLVYVTLSIRVAERVYPLDLPLYRLYAMMVLGGVLIGITFVLQSESVSLSQLIAKLIPSLLTCGLPFVLRMVTQEDVHEVIAWGRARLKRRTA